MSSSTPEVRVDSGEGLATDGTEHLISESQQKPPDGGLRAWSQVLMAHLVIFNTWGYANSFGIFESYYVTILPQSRSDIAWIGSIQIFLVYLLGAFSGRATDAGFCRVALACGSLLQLLGVLMASISTKYWQLLLTQGVCQGVGNGIVFCPTIALVSTFFSRRRTLAISLSASGASTGGIVFPLVAEQLLPKLGFAWTLRVMGLIMFANVVMILALVRTRTPARKSGPLIDWMAFADLSYTLFCVGSFLNLWAVYFAYYYVSTFARDIIGVSSTTSLIILLIMNGVGIPGRAIPAFISDKLTGPLNILIPVSFCASLIFYTWALVHDLTGLYVFSVIYGLFGAAAQGLFPASCVSLTVDLQKMGVRTGMAFSIVSISCLTGPPIAGLLIERDGGEYLYAQVFGGTAFLAGGLMLTAARISQTGFVLKRRI